MLGHWLAPLACLVIGHDAMWTVKRRGICWSCLRCGRVCDSAALPPQEDAR